MKSVISRRRRPSLALAAACGAALLPLGAAARPEGAPAASTADVAGPSLPSPSPLEETSGALLLLPPGGAAGPDALLVILTGARIPAAQYVDVARAIQGKAAARLWVAIPKFPFDTPNPLLAPGSFDAAVNDARAAGFGAAGQVFLAGHSLGGIMAKDVAVSRSVAGLLLLASYLPRLPFSQALETFPLPTAS